MFAAVRAMLKRIGRPTVTHVERRPRPSINDALHRKLAEECGYVRGRSKRTKPEKN